MHYEFTADNYRAVNAASNEPSGFFSKLSDGSLMQGAAGGAFDFVYDHVPSRADFDNPNLIGQLQATET